MDPKHRDRVAFLRLASGHFKRGMKLTHVRTGKPMAVSNPVLFLAADRNLAEEAWAGDIIGIPNHGQLRIGDTLTEGEALRATGIPSFAPELLQSCSAADPMKAGHLEKALMQFAEEGAAKVFKPQIGAGYIVGVVGQLQFDVLLSRIELEYGLPVRFDATQSPRRAGSAASAARSTPSPRPTGSTSPTTMTAIRSFCRGCNGTSTGWSATIRSLNCRRSRKPWRRRSDPRRADRCLHSISAGVQTRRRSRRGRPRGPDLTSGTRPDA